jgi:NAD(P)-dependent dehydrogenase (short-subunit alcohol dehydrogenase family)
MARKYDINGRTVFITGAARGIGAAAAERFHSKGANVALVGLEPERLEALADRLGDRAIWFEADVTDLDALQRAARGTAEWFGGIDVAIANAGVHFIGSVATAPVEMFERELMVNLFGVWRTDRAVLPYVTERQGYLLNVASLAACSHAPLMGAYAASKAGVEGLTNSLRQETAPTGARVGCAYFGFIDTDIVRGSFAHPSTQALESLMPPFVRTAVPLSRAVDAIDRGVERRQSKVWAPRYVGGALAFRGMIQPVVERRAMRSPRLPEALRLADPVSGGVEGQDMLLGVAGEALPKGETAQV